MTRRQAIVVIDLRNVRTAKTLHRLLMKSLGFPDWYGRNWDAFWDAITGLVEMPIVLRLNGWEEFASRLSRDARLMKACLDGMSVQFPQLASQVEYG